MNPTRHRESNVSFMSRSSTPDAPRASLSERRTSNRGPVQTKARLVLLDPFGEGASYDILTRDGSLSETTFLLREPLSVGQQCRIEIPDVSGKVRKYLAEVVRSRPITGGRFEMAIHFRKSVL
ncbi:MAG: hypothetical protein KatS3mg104_2627 [Phycisphaerae bacterium]|jgi:hypothetical protein|nr:MAG: hypothetical protein KatS3mg104_2627 [Phycisphaerae bacterium]